MTSNSGYSVGSLRAAGLALCLLGLAVATPALAENAAAPPNPIEEFNTEVGKVKGSLESLNKRIEQSVKEIETLSKPEDNGEVATFGVKALAFAHNKQKELQADTKFAAADREYLLGEWKRIIAETEKATNDLSGARQEFSQLLRTVQTRGDYIEELQAINSAQRMLEVIRTLAGELRSASDVMKSFIRSLSPPGT
jgi:archaellum component FlaC